MDTPGARTSVGLSKGYLTPSLLAFVGAAVCGIAIFPLCPGMALALPFLVAASVIDVRDRILPDMLTLPAIAAACFATWMWGNTADCMLALGVALGMGTALRFIRPEGFGLGDAKLLAAVAVAGGSQILVETLLFGSIAGIAFSLIRRTERSNGIPAGPSLVGGSVVATVFQSVLEHYNLFPHLSPLVR